MFTKILVANRGEIACRIVRAARSLGVTSVAVYSEADANARHVREADDAVPIGPASPGASYLDAARLTEAARASGAEAVHPGYGFLSENAAFAEAVVAAGLTWIGPTPESIALLGDKIEARRRMAAAGVPVLPGTFDPLADEQEAAEIAEHIGYPVILKAAAGGGGMGMVIARDRGELLAAYPRIRELAQRLFGSPSLLLERYVPAVRHVEIQVFGLDDGRVVALGDRECSVQRRYQKVFEETPSPAVGARLREDMLRAASAGAEHLGYRNAGTVEFLVADGRFFFLEVNSRIQVEHPITEMVTGIDLVAAQIRAAAKEPGFEPDAVRISGHAVELRVCAEDAETFLPGPGRIHDWHEPGGEGIRVDSGYAAGDEVTRYYDSLMAKVCAWGPDRDSALDRAAVAVREFRIAGPKSNLPFLARLLASAELRSGQYDTRLLERMTKPSGERV